MAVALASEAEPPSRAEIQRWIELGAVTLSGRAAQAKDRVREGASVEIVRPRGRTSDASPDASVRFDVLFVDESIVVLVKPAGLVVHPAAGHDTGTLVHGLLARGWFRAEDFASSEDETAHFRPGIVHRLDKGTSGVMVVARTAMAREALKAQFQVHSIERAYDAITVGVAATKTHRTLHGRDARDRMRFTSRVAQGKHAVTHVTLVAPLAEGRASLVRCTLETGRTHQIRVHLAESGTPVLGDPLYGKPPRDDLLREVGAALGHQALHARVLGLVHPLTGQRMRFEADFPPDFAMALTRLGAASGSGA